MNSWITGWKKIGIRIKKILKRQPTDVQISEWLNCPTCKKISYLPDLVKNKYICECSYHFDLPPEERLKDLFSENYEIIDAPKTNPAFYILSWFSENFNMFFPSLHCQNRRVHPPINNSRTLLVSAIARQ